jgi:hypothetical protein
MAEAQPGSARRGSAGEADLPRGSPEERQEAVVNEATALDALNQLLAVAKDAAKGAPSKAQAPGRQRASKRKASGGVKEAVASVGSGSRGPRDSGCLDSGSPYEQPSEGSESEDDVAAGVFDDEDFETQMKTLL